MGCSFSTPAHSKLKVKSMKAKLILLKFILKLPYICPQIA